MADASKGQEHQGDRGRATPPGESTKVGRIGFVHDPKRTLLELSDDERRAAEEEAQRRMKAYRPTDFAAEEQRKDSDEPTLRYLHGHVVPPHLTHQGVMNTIGNRVPTITDTLIVVNGNEQNVMPLSGAAEFNVGWRLPLFHPGGGETPANYIYPLYLDYPLTIHFRFVRVQDNTVIDKPVDLAAGVGPGDPTPVGAPADYGAYNNLQPLSAYGLRAGMYNFRPYVEWHFGPFSMAPYDYFFQLR